MVLTHDESEAVGIELRPVGQSAAASTLSYLDNGYVFVGSRAGDSQLVRLHPEPVAPDQPNNHVEVGAARWLACLGEKVEEATASWCASTQSPPHLTSQTITSTYVGRTGWEGSSVCGACWEGGRGARGHV
eukprot:354313-Chlamydomonas_euryale.AAC.4